MTPTPEQLAEVFSRAKESFASRKVGASLEAEIETITIDSPLLSQVHALICHESPITATRAYKETQAYHRFLRQKSTAAKFDFGLSGLAFAHYLPAVYSSWLSVLRAPVKAAGSDHPEKSFTNDERQALAYVGGFFLRKLKAVKSVDTGPLIDSWLKDDDDHHEFNEWTEQQDRGGLLVINEQFFEFLVLLDSVATECLAQVSANCMLSDILFRGITSNQVVRDCWRQHLDQFEYSAAASDSLLICLISSFCNLRCVAYVSAMKRGGPEASGKPTQSLRQQLDST